MDTELQARIEDVQKQILSAFADVTLGDGVGLREADVIDEYGSSRERREARKSDELHNWQRIPDEAIEYNPSVLCMMDAEGLRFHVPAFMRYTLLHFVDSDHFCMDSLIYRLCDKECIGKLKRILTEEQIATTIRFLKVCLEIGDDWLDITFIPKALVQWQKKLSWFQRMF